jgi:hypothetical protein
MVRTFLSHSSLDKDLARLVADDLAACGVETWLDEIELLVGDQLSQRIREAISASEYLAVFVSHDSLGSRWVAVEIAYAKEVMESTGCARLLPILTPGLKNEEIPEVMRDYLGMDIREAGKYGSQIETLIRQLNPSALPKSSYGYWGLSLDARRKKCLVDAGKGARFHSWVVDHLKAILQANRDPSQRYWAYVALGELAPSKNDSEELRLLKAGMEDRDPFARAGAIEGTKIVEQIIRRRQ